MRSRINAIYHRPLPDIESIEALRTVTEPPVEMQEKWSRSHANYVEKSAWIKQMLSM